MAVLETKPDAKPEIASPPWAPSRRIETYCADGHYQNNDNPDRAWIERDERADRPIRMQGRAECSRRVCMATRALSLGARWFESGNRSEICIARSVADLRESIDQIAFSTELARCSKRPKDWPVSLGSMS